jgi:hypothetical protein
MAGLGYGILWDWLIGNAKKVPPRLLLFYKHQSMDAQGNVTNEIWTIIQTCNYQVDTAKRQ